MTNIKALVLGITLIFPLAASTTAAELPKKSNPSAPKQSSSAAEKDGLGISLVEGLSAKDVISLIAPDENPAQATLVGARRWPFLANAFVTIACFSDHASRPGESTCDSFDGEQPKRVYLGVISYGVSGNRPQLLARGMDAFNLKTNWDNSNLSAPDSLVDGGILPATYMEFDLAPYKISETETAFGLRYGWNEMLAGGGRSFQALALFKITGDKISNVLTEPISASEMIAGNWHKDGTRDHEFNASENLLIVLSTKTNGYFDIAIKEKSKSAKKWQQRFVWDRATNRYLAQRP